MQNTTPAAEQKQRGRAVEKGMIIVYTWRYARRDLHSFCPASDTVQRAGKTVRCLESSHWEPEMKNHEWIDGELLQTNKIEALDPVFSVCKVEDYAGVNLDQPFCFTGRTDEEKSLVCPIDQVPENTISREDGWRGFRICGELDFSLIGVLAGISKILANNQIGIFAISTFNTDYILMKEESFEKALLMLRDSGYRIKNTGENE